MTRLSTRPSPSVYDARSVPVVQCEEDNWTGGDCQHRTRWRCPYCFRAACGTHRNRHALDPRYPGRLACQWFSYLSMMGAFGWQIDHALIQEGAARELARRAELESRASDRAVQVCTVEVG